jgi:putative ABC transport system permease protein
LGLFVAWTGVRLIHAFTLTDIPRMENARIDAGVVGFTLVISVLSALISGVWPAWKASAVHVSETLKLGATATTCASRSQMRDLLAIAEIAAAVTLLVASGLVVKSFVQLTRADWGFNPENLLLIDVKLPRAMISDRAALDDLSDSVRARLKIIPGVEHVTVGRNAPIRWGSWSSRPVAVDGRVPPDLTAGVWVVGQGHFAAAGIPIHEGREFSEADDAVAPRRVVVSQALARRLWPNQSAVGKSLEILEIKSVNGKPAPGVVRQLQQSLKATTGWPLDRALFDAVGGVPWEVIGVASDVRMFGLNIKPNPALYLESRQLPATRGWGSGSSLKVLLRTKGAPTEVADAAKAQILAANPELTFSEIVPLATLVAQSVGGRGSNKLLVIVATVFGTLALTFATIGIYGVVAHNVSQRLREIGIRVALGATAHDVTRVVLGYGIRLLLSGLALGVTTAWAATRGMGALLFATTPTDAFTYAAAIVLLVAAMLLACALPLRRAVRFDPIVLFKA